MPQHCEEEPQLAPCPTQPPPLQMPAEQVSVLQHWLEDEQDAPWPLQPLLPVHTLPTQVSVLQHCDELAQVVPAPWQPPPVQTLLELQVMMPQQSALDSQR